MRYLLFFLLLALGVGAKSQPQTTVPTSDQLLQSAYSKAKASNKKVFIVFQASWCGWCRKMDLSLEDASVKPLIDKFFETVHLTVYESASKKYLENRGAIQLLTRLGGADKGLPYWYVLNADGGVISDSQYEPGKNTGCPASVEEVAYFIKILKSTTSLSEDELEVIRKRFLQNE